MFAFLLIAYIIILGIRYSLEVANLTYLRNHGSTVPSAFLGVIDPDRLRKITDYTFEKSRMDIAESVFGNVLMVAFLFGGLLGYYDRWVAGVSGSFIGQGVVFALVLLYAETVLGLPFILYRNFKIENRYGFNTMTVRIWFLDLLKSQAIATILGSLVVM